MFEGNPFIEIAAILGLALFIGIIGQRLRQPLIIMFLAAGILAGPSGLGIIQSYHQIELLAQIGIALLLFIVGLKLDLHLIRTTGPVALATGLGQIVFTSLIGFLIAIAFEMSYLTAAYVAVALTFSSTIIIVKLLSDKKEIDSLHGQIAIGFLIVQDIAAILALIVLTTFGSPVAEDGSVALTTVIIIAKGLGFLGVVGLLMRFVLPGLTRRLAHSLELLTLFAIAWAVSLSAVSEILGFSKEVGAFLAGISLASTNYRDSIGARLTSLRDFLLLFFFIDLGARLDWSTVGAQLVPSFVFSVFVLVGNPLIVLIIMGFMGYRRRTAFLAGLTVAQISEFSLIVVALGLSIGHITGETVGLVTLVGVITIFLSTYMILYSARLYAWLSTPLKIFERRDPYREAGLDTPADSQAVDVIMAGMGKYGSGLAEYLLKRDKAIVGVDFDPDVLDKWRKRGVPVLYGDMTDPEMYEHLPLHKARWVISTVRSGEMNLAMLRTLRHMGYEGKIAMTASNDEEYAALEREGAQLVFRPYADATEQAADAITFAIDSVPDNFQWPVAFLEERIRSDATVIGRTIRDIPLRSETGVTILAISRGGRIHYDPDPDFRIYPADRLLLMGPHAGLNEAVKMLGTHALQEITGETERFGIAEIPVAAASPLAGCSLADIRFRQTYGVTLVGIRRGEEQITAVQPEEELHPGDHIIIVGSGRAVDALKTKGSL